MKITQQRLKEIIKEELLEVEDNGLPAVMRWAQDALRSLEPLMELPVPETHAKHRDAVWNLLSALQRRGGTLMNLRAMPEE